jgi:hypothetical protein
MGVSYQVGWAKRYLFYHAGIPDAIEDSRMDEFYDNRIDKDDTIRKASIYEDDPTLDPNIHVTQAWQTG